MALENCEPKRVFHYFEEISKIPRGSGNTAEISNYLVQFAKEHELEHIQDELGNVIIRKPASPGYENAPGVIIQGHMDMVCDKRPDVEHDFMKDGLNLSVENGYVTANGTTLGGDDGLAIAYGLAILESNEIAHPALEVVITVDEEIGLIGAEGMDCSVLKGKRLLNIDSEEEGFLLVSCAGGLSGTSHIPVARTEAEGEKLKVKVCGLKGGHSGIEIDKGRANASLLLGQFLYKLKIEIGFGLISLEGGQKDNAIPREAAAELLVTKEDAEAVKELAVSMEKELRAEYAGTDEEISIVVEEQGQASAAVLHPTSCEKVIFYLMNIVSGVVKMSGTIEDLVETSTNMGVMRLSEDEFTAVSNVRSSVGAAKDMLSHKIAYLTEFLGGEYDVKGSFPAWEYRKESPLREKMIEVYKEMYGEEPKVIAIHAGLECGLFFRKIENLDCISFGPDMKYVHTSEELLSVASTQRVWKYLLRILEVLKD